MNLDKKLPTDVEQLKKIAETTDNFQMKRSIEDRLKRMSQDSTISK